VPNTCPIGLERPVIAVSRVERLITAS